MSSKGFKAKKSLGQNFLKDAQVIERIAEAAGCGEEDTVVEIGPGLGALTDALSERAGRVIAVELDDRLIPVLRTKFALRDNVEIVHGDILKFDWSSASPGSGCLYIAGNLPYYITTPILLGILEKKVPAKRITVMVQKEVADRMQAGPGTKDYGALSLAVQYYSKAEIVANVPANCFMPRPKVGSAVIRLARYAEPPVAVKDPALMFRVISAAFGQRRKTLVNALAGAPDLGLSKQQAQDAVGAAGFPANSRGEALTVKDVANVADAAGM
jgi:16S rRNA (adenine1518-N6/adenine1519-N6)-dimethyltransferase